MSVRALAAALSGLLLTSMVFAAEEHGAEGGSLLFGFLLSVVNFTIFVGLFAYFAWPLLTAALAERRKLVVKELSEADEAHRQAATLVAEVRERHGRIAQEGERLRAELRAEAQHDRERLIEAARVTAERIRNDARLLAEQEAARAAHAIREQVATQVIARVVEALRGRLTTDDQDRFVADFAAAVEAGDDR